MHEFYKTVNYLNVQSHPAAMYSPFIDKAVAFANIVLPINSKRRKFFKYVLQKCQSRFS